MKIKTQDIPTPTYPQLSQLAPGDVFHIPTPGMGSFCLLPGTSVYLRGRLSAGKIHATRLSDGESTSFHMDEEVIKHEATLNLES